MTSNIEMNFENLSKEDSDKLIRKGITMPLLVNTSTISDLTILAGKLSDQNTFPIIFRINSIKGTGTINGEENPGGPTVISGEEMYATSTQTNELHLDSISGKHLDTSLRQELTATFNGVENELRSSERMIKVGDTITQQIPYNMMINGLDAAFTITATYKLISIKKGIAKFDIDQTSQFTMNKKGSSQVLTGKGGGHGSMTYDTKRNFPKTISRDLSFDFKMQYKGILMKSKATIVSYYFFSVVNSPAN
ncbi:MAG TPA: hypothetical protein VHB54_22000 [Mucilaginibacter sp.]|nr:hypothetical protein [Mucilaginibacter sp.]